MIDFNLAERQGVATDDPDSQTCEPGAAVGQLLPDEQDLARFAAAVFKHADPKGFVSLRAFLDAKKDAPPLFVVPISIGDPQFLPVVVERAKQAANWYQPAVFCPPVVTLKNGRNAKADNVQEGVTLPVECDAEPTAALEYLRDILGDPTVVVASGGEWTNPDTGEVEQKVHVHWRLKVPTRTAQEHARLREARNLATKLVGADATAVPLVHPLRWPGSWHRKGAPRLAQIIFESENEIDLDEALGRLREAAGAQVTGGATAVVDADADASFPERKLQAAHPEDIAAALKVIPNKDLPWVEWNEVGLATYAASGGSDDGRQAFEEWSAKSPKNDPTTTRARWDHYRASPPDRIGMGTLVYLARKHDPSWRLPSQKKAGENVEVVDPVDLWGKFEPPSLPRGLLPDVIERFAYDQGMDMGADMSAIAVSALAVCAGAIPDSVRLQVKRHNTGWFEPARLWVALVGPPSSKKSPIMTTAARPLRRIDADQARDYADQRAVYDKLPKEEKLKTNPPKQVRSILQDTTIEAAQDVAKDSPDGLLCYQDELSGWFGSMDKYSAGRGSAKDRSFWLEAYNGGTYSVQRVGRGLVYIDNLSISLIGGIQPEPIRQIADEAVDDGLLQRLLPIMVAPARAGRDEAASPVVAEYEALIRHLHCLGNATLRFDDGAQAYRQELELKHLNLLSLEFVHRKLASHIGKYDGIFARLCVIWHCIENMVGFGDIPAVISETTARRVGAFLHGFLLPHAMAFYTTVLGLSNDHDCVTAVAGYILSHGLTKITNRDLKRGDRVMRRLSPEAGLAVFEQLEAFGWLERAPSPLRGAPAHWLVNPAVHQKFAERAKVEAARRAEVRKTIADALGAGVEP